MLPAGLPFRPPAFPTSATHVATQGSATSVDRLAELSENTEAMRKAMRYVEEWRMAKVTEGQNRAKAVTPSTGAALNRFEEVRMSTPVDIRPKPWGTAAMPAARKRMTRWRRRFGGCIGKLRVREEVPLDVMREKVARAIGGANPQPRGGRGGPKFKAGFRTRFRGRFRAPQT